MSAIYRRGSMADVDDAAAPLGPWADADLGATARVDAGIGADEGLPTNVRFVSNVAKLIRRRRAQPNANLDPKRPAVFLLQSVPPDATPAAVGTRVPMLDNGLTVVTGRIWFVGPVAASGRFFD